MTTEEKSGLLTGESEDAAIKALMAYLKTSDTLKSLLYDLDLLPEQAGNDGLKNFRMLTTISHFKSSEDRLRSQNAELLEALKESLSENVMNTWLDRDKWKMRNNSYLSGLPLPAWVDKARSAIQRSEGAK